RDPSRPADLEERRLRLDHRDLTGQRLHRGQREALQRAGVLGQAPRAQQRRVRIDAGAQRTARPHRFREPLTEAGLPGHSSVPSCRIAACSFCSERTPMLPWIAASMPCTAAAAPCTVVTQGTSRDTAAVRISYPSTRGPGLPYGVLMIMSISPDLIMSTTSFSPSATSSVCLRTTVAGIPFRRSTSAVPVVARISKPRSASRLTGKTSARLSLLATETNTRPLVGSEP